MTLAENLSEADLNTVRNVIFGFAFTVACSFSSFKTLFRLDAPCATQNSPFQNRRKKREKVTWYMDKLPKNERGYLTSTTFVKLTNRKKGKGCAGDTQNVSLESQHAQIVKL